MIRIKELVALLKSFEPTIICNMCGECCGDCPTRRGNLCGAHPEYNGENPAPNQRAGTCWANPVELLKYNQIVCPIVEAKLNELGYVLITYRNERGIPVVADILSKD